MEKSGQNGQSKTPTGRIADFFLLWPFVLGLALARSGLTVVNYESYSHTDAGFFMIETILISLLLTALALPILFIQERHLNKRFCQNLAIGSILLSGCLLISIAALSGQQSENAPLYLTLSIGIAFFGRLTMFYWLRWLSGMSPRTTIVATFSALLLSEILIGLFVFLSALAAFAIASLGVFTQLLLIPKAQSQSQLFVAAASAPADGRDYSNSTDDHAYFSLAKALLANRQLLLFSAIAIALTAIVNGFLCGFPDGRAIAFTPTTRISYALLTIALCALIIALALRGQKNVMRLGIWIIMQVLACLALLCYAACPANLAIGAIFATTMNVMMLGFTWYTIVAFSSFGQKDPYYYAIICFALWVGCRSLARGALYSIPSITGSTLVGVLIGVALLVSAQIIYTQHISIARSEAKSVLERISARPPALNKIMGLDMRKSLDELRKSAMVQSARDVGRQFLLSEREIEVLSIYALGLTQKRVARELHVSESTVHTHIKRIYAKTGIHSRQALIDYIREHAD